MRNCGQIMSYDLSVWMGTNKSQLPINPKNYAKLNVK